MIKRMTRAIAGGMVLLSAACTAPAPATDTTPPEITVTVSGVGGRNVFRSIDGKQGPTDSCIIVPREPTQLILIAGDSGGIQTVTLRAVVGRIVPESVDVTPRPPEGSYEIRSDPGGDTLVITLTPPSPGIVRTGATAIFNIASPTPISIVATATDRADHSTELPQFDLRGAHESVICRNSR